MEENVVQVMPPEQQPISRLSSLRDIKQKLLADHRKYRKGILDRVERSNVGFNTDQLLNLIIEDMLNSTEDLQGSMLMMESEGNMKDASILTIKRADLLKLVAEIVSKKKELSQRSGEVDLNSPAFCIFQKLCFDKMVESLEEMKTDPEMLNLILTRWQGKMKNWGSELKKALKDLEE